MLFFLMVVIVFFVGVLGFGVEVYCVVFWFEVGMGFEVGILIVILVIILDCIM